MKHKEKECAWAPGMQDTDVTFAGDHTWAAIRLARKKQGGPSHRGQSILLAVGLAALGAAIWWLG